MISIKIFFKQTVFYTFIQVLPALAGFILLKIYSDVLSKDEYAILNLLNTYSVLFFSIISLSSDSIVTRFYYTFKNNRKLLSDLYGSIAIGLVVVSAIMILIAFPFHYVLNHIFSSPTLIILVVLWALNLSFIKFFQSIFRVERNNTMLLWFSISTFVGQILGVIIGFYIFENKTIAILAGRFILVILVIILFQFLIKNKFTFRLRLNLLKETLPFFYPIIIYNILYWISSQFDQTVFKIMIEDNSQLAIYAMAFNLTVVNEFILNAINAHIVPEFNELMTERKEGYLESIKTNAHLFILISLTGVIFTLIFSQILLDVYINPIYTDSALFIGLLCASYVLRLIYSVYSIPIYFFNKTLILPIIFTGSAIVNITCNVLLIPRIGLWSLVLSLFLARIIQTVAIAIISHRIFPIKYNYTKMLTLPLLLVILLAIGTWIRSNYNINYYYIWASVSAILGLAIWFSFQTQIKDTINTLKNKYLLKS
ncbi:MAG: oligosaccharide flippase family protein [Bacteroidales bacterium]|nr:oligosaccharide flippase family protein [Bacteroidales bacterium]